MRLSAQTEWNVSGLGRGGGGWDFRELTGDLALFGLGEGGFDVQEVHETGV